MAWAAEFDCIRQFEKFLLLEGAATQVDLDEIRKKVKKEVRNEQKTAWADFRASFDSELEEVIELIHKVAGPESAEIADLRNAVFPGRAELHGAARRILQSAGSHRTPASEALLRWSDAYGKENRERYSQHLYSASDDSALAVPTVKPDYSGPEEQADGRQILQKNFEALFEKYPEVLTFGEDTGGIGGVNQSMEGMQDKFGETRVADTGIRECTIAGQGIGLALRGFRPIAEIQYLDYLYYALQILRDDAATVRYRTCGGQKAPVIIRTRGHRLEGIWHSGSPMGAIIHSLRGMHICVPRNMTEAAGMYNTLLQAEEPAVVVECLNGYRSKEPVPRNMGEFTVPLGIPEVVQVGEDISLVSYGSTFNIAAVAAERLEKVGVRVELIDARTLLPFDNQNVCAASVGKTNRLLVIDEDVPGGASAYIMEDILNRQGAWKYLDVAPKTIAAQPHLPPYGTDGDYYAKPNVEDIYEAVMAIMVEAEPNRFG
jgi:pyruvate/2-oxoglutarate/acetoin dehydrogenase E1 component